MAAVLFVACLICAYGFISLLAGIDIIPEGNDGPLIGPIMAAMASGIVFVGVLAALSRPGSLRRPQWAIVVVTSALVYLLPALFGALVVAFDQTDAFAGVLFFAARATGPFVPTSAALAFVLVLVTPLVLRRAN
jgi:hypothetical protein